MHRTSAIQLALPLLAAFAASFGLLRWQSGSRGFAAAVTNAKEVADQCATVSALRRQAATMPSAARAPNDLAARIAAALVAALGTGGAATTRFDVAAGGESSVASASGAGSGSGAGSSQLRQQVSTVTFRSIRIDAAGKLLQALRERAAPWTLESVELRRADSGQASGRYDLVVGCAAVFVSSSNARPR